MWGDDNMIEFLDETSEFLGTDINRANMMALQGFIGNTIYVDDVGNIIQTNSKGETKTITPFNNGVRKTIFEGKKTITLSTSFDNNKIVEVVS